MDKIVRLGTIRTYNRRGMSVYARITLEDGKLSICGVEGPLPSGNCLGGCGQIGMSLNPSEFQTFAPGWSRAKVAEFLQVWDKWHLNNMREGCEHQRIRGWTYEGHHDPETFQGEACPVCGYKIGSSWLKEELPKGIVHYLESLPNSDRTPAWC